MDQASAQETRFLLTIHSHGLGFLGLFTDLPKAQEMAQEDERLRRAANNEDLEPGDECWVEPVTLSWGQRNATTWSSVFDVGHHEHYYEITQFTTGELLDGF